MELAILTHSSNGKGKCNVWQCTWPSSSADQYVTHRFWSHETGSNIAWSREKQTPKERLYYTVRFSFEAGFYKLLFYFPSVPAGRQPGCKIKKRIIRKFILIIQNYQKSSRRSAGWIFISIWEVKQTLFRGSATRSKWLPQKQAAFEINWTAVCIASAIKGAEFQKRNTNNEVFFLAVVGCNWELFLFSLLVPPGA